MSQFDLLQTRARSGEADDAELRAGSVAAECPGMHQHLDLLRKSLERPSLKQETTKDRSWASASVIARRCIKTVVSLALIAVLGWIPLQRLLVTTSAEATVNARVITLRAPIEGRIVNGEQVIGAGTAFSGGDLVLRIENPRADRARLDELRTSISLLRDQRKSSVERLAGLERQHADQLAQFEKFQRHRIEHLEARRREILADKDAVIARLDAASLALKRSTTLNSRGIQADAAYEQAQRDHKVFTATLAAAQRRLEAIDIELVAGHEGVFVTDGFNDVPRSAQRASEIGQQIDEVTVTLAEQDRRLASLREQLVLEERRYDLMSVAELRSPTDGQVWEMLISPGENVRLGQELMKILDCNAAVVTAAVSESNFNRLQIGGRATFRLRGDSRELPGRIIGLYGLGSAPANLAIHQGMLAREPYHATIEFPDLATREACQIGRTGIVTFEAASSAWLP